MARVKYDDANEYYLRECALSRSLSPAMVAGYQLHLPDRQVLRTKLRELTDVAVLETADDDADDQD